MASSGVLVPIQTITVGAGGVASVIFDYIPQTFTDLVIEASSRLDANPESSPWSSFKVFFNGDTSTLYSYTALYGTGSGAGSERASTQTVSQAGWTSSSAATSSVFGSAKIHIPNYTSANYKAFIADAVSENNATASIQTMVAGLYRSTNAITSVTFTRAGANFVAGSTFTLYGTLKA